MLQVNDVDVGYDDLQVLWDVSIEVRESDDVVAIIGPNGAGKTTLLRTISGILSPTSGDIQLFGEPVHSLSPHEIVSRGFVHVSEERNLFPDLTVRENLEMGGFTQPDDVESNLEEVYDLFPVLEERSGQNAGTLSGGEQQMLAIGRGLMADPKLLAIDECSEGLAPQLVEKTFEKLRIIGQDVPIVLVEQHVDEALELADRAYLLEQGRIATSGSGEEFLEKSEIKDSYLSG